jgi:signal transduction histidine kinase
MNDSIFYITVVISILLGIILTFFIVSIVRYHKRYIKLQRERIHAEITIQENERRRIATDLHDSLGPLLSSVKLQINSIEPAAKEDEKIVTKAGQYLDEIINNLKEISYNLLPKTLQRKGLSEAIREFIRNVRTRQPISIDYYQPHALLLLPEQETHIFRMIQEIVHNSIKHSGAKNLEIAIKREKKDILILTKDDGKGFDAEKIKKNSAGLGLKSIESRIEILKGSYILQSAPDKGTSYFIRIPFIENPGG